MRFLSKCLRENFASPLMYVAAVIFAAFCVAGAEVVFGDTKFSFMELAFNEEMRIKAVSTIECSSSIMATRFSASSWYSIGLAVLAAVPPLFVYKNKLEKIHLLSLIRADYKSYSAGVVFSAFISGMFVTVVGIMLYIAASFLLFPSFESFAEPIYELIYGTAAERCISLIQDVCNHAFVGGIIPVFAIVLYRLTRSDFLAATIPMMLMYVSVKIMPNLREWISWGIESTDRAPAQVFMSLFPSNLTHLGSSFSALNVPFWVAYIVLCAILFGLYFAFYRSAKKV